VLNQAYPVASAWPSIEIVLPGAGLIDVTSREAMGERKYPSIGKRMVISRGALTVVRICLGETRIS